MTLGTIQYGLWILGAVLQLAVALAMVKRQLRREYPVFFAYLVFQFVSFCIQFPLFHWSYKGYFTTYWTSAAISSVMEFAVIHEIFTHVFRPYEALRDLGNVLFRWAVLVLLLVAVVSAASGSNPQLSRLVAGIFSLERGVRLMQCGLVLFLFLFSTYLGLSSRHRVFGISLGFGIAASADVIVMTLVARLGLDATAFFSFLNCAAFAMCVGIWLWYMLNPEPERRRVDHVGESEKWNFALAGVVNPAPDAFLPMIEDAVERVLTRRQELPFTQPSESSDPARPN